MKVQWKGDTKSRMLTNGKVYDVISVEQDWYRVIDDSGEDFLYPPEFFTVVSK